MASFDDWENQAAELKAQAARERACADANLRGALEQLERLIQNNYENALVVCPEIRVLMYKYPFLQECYPGYWELCAL